MKYCRLCLKTTGYCMFFSFWFFFLFVCFLFLGGGACVCVFFYSFDLFYSFFSVFVLLLLLLLLLLLNYVLYSTWTAAVRMKSPILGYGNPAASTSFHGSRRTIALAGQNISYSSPTLFYC